jgi:excisionase family DNA binding protein
MYLNMNSMNIKNAISEAHENKFTAAIRKQGVPGYSLEKAIMTLTTHQTEASRLVYTTGEAAALLNVSQKSIYRLIQRSKLRCIASVRHKRIPRSELERFVRDELK